MAIDSGIPTPFPLLSLEPRGLRDDAFLAVADAVVPLAGTVPIDPANGLLRSDAGDLKREHLLLGRWRCGTGGGRGAWRGRNESVTGQGSRRSVLRDAAALRA